MKGFNFDQLLRSYCTHEYRILHTVWADWMQNYSNSVSLPKPLIKPVHHDCVLLLLNQHGAFQWLLASRKPISRHAGHRCNYRKRDDTQIITWMKWIFGLFLKSQEKWRQTNRTRSVRRRNKTEFVLLHPESDLKGFPDNRRWVYWWVMKEDLSLYVVQCKTKHVQKIKEQAARGTDVGSVSDQVEANH